MPKLAPIYRKLLKEAGQAAGSLELRKTPTETIVKYANSLGLRIPNLQANLETAYDLFGMGKTNRKDMPVLDDKDVRDFQKHLKNGFIDLTDPWSDRTNQDDPFPQGLTDKEATDFIGNGVRDKSKSDDVIKTRIRMVAAKDLIPIQAQVYASKSLGSIAKGGIESTINFLKSTTLVISSDQRIIDGHHRFLSALIIDPEMKLKCLEVDLQIKHLLPLARAYGDAKGNQRNENMESNMISFTKGTLKENLQRLMETSPNGAGTSEEYRADVAGIGEDVWSTNGIAYDTPEKAKEWLTQLADRWFGYDMSRVVPVSTAKRETIDPSDPTIFQNFRD